MDKHKINPIIDEIVRKHQLACFKELKANGFIVGQLEMIIKNLREEKSLN